MAWLRSRSRGKSLALQQFRLRQLFPKAQVLARGLELVFVAELTPSAISDTYRIRLRYALGRAPRVEVLSPDLGPIDNCQLPHTHEDGRLCLYLPANREWDPDLFLADTIAPWASEWLANYETWAFTGRWLGGGTHPGHWDRPPSDRREGSEEPVSSSQDAPVAQLDRVPF